MWIEKLGTTANCTKFTNMPVGYGCINDESSFDDWPYSSFGGWK